eukprot:5773859-Prorocentrum_lima.AAC.1
MSLRLQKTMVKFRRPHSVAFTPFWNVAACFRPTRMSEAMPPPTMWSERFHGPTKPLSSSVLP